MLCGGSARKMGDLGRALGVQSRKGASSCAGVRSRDGIRGHLAHDDREIRVTMLAPEYSLVLDPSGALVTLLGLLEALQRAAAHAQRHVHVALYDSPGFLCLPRPTPLLRSNTPQSDEAATIHRSQLRTLSEAFQTGSLKTV